MRHPCCQACRRPSLCLRSKLAVAVLVLALGVLETTVVELRLLLGRFWLRVWLPCGHGCGPLCRVVEFSAFSHVRAVLHTLRAASKLRTCCV